MSNRYDNDQIPPPIAARPEKTKSIVGHFFGRMSCQVITVRLFSVKKRILNNGDLFFVGFEPVQLSE